MSQKKRDSGVVDKEIIKIIGKPKKSEVVGFGTVKFYSNDPNKQFGFLAAEIGDVFVHGSRCYQLANNGTQTPGLSFASRTVEGSLLDPPKRGEQVLFVAEGGPKGHRSVRWVKWSDDILDTILDEIGQQPSYQLVERNGPETEELVLGENRFNVLWEGKCLEELRSNFPKFQYPIFNDDSGALYFLSDEQGEWQHCKDPR